MSQTGESNDGFLQKLKNKDYKEQLYYTAWIGVAMFCQGLLMGQVGPTFLDIQIISGTGINRASYFLTALAIGYLVGTAATGIIGNRINKCLLVSLSLFGVGAASIVLPYCRLYGLMMTLHVLGGMFTGLAATAANAEHMRVWGNEGRGLLQLIHLLLAIGAVVSPLYVSPFLAKRHNVESFSSSTSSLLVSSTHHPLHKANFNSSGILVNSTNDHHNASATFIVYTQGNITSKIYKQDSTSNKNTSSMGVIQRKTNVHYAFLITGIANCISSVPFMYLFITKKSIKRLGNVSNRESVASDRVLPNGISSWFYVGLFVYNFLGDACLRTFDTYIMTFVIREFDTVSKPEGAYIVAVYWGIFAGARFIMIFVSQKYNPTKLLCFCMAISLVSLSGFLGAVHLRSVPFFTVLVGIYGVGQSAMFASGFSWCESRLFHVDTRVAAFIIFSRTVGTMAATLLIGYLMQEVANIWFCYVLLICMVVMIVVFAAINVFNNVYVVSKFGERCRQEEDPQEIKRMSRDKDSKTV